MLPKPIKMLTAALQFKLAKKRNLIKVGHRITHRCNYRCSYCSLWSDDVNELDTREVLKLVDEVADMGCAVYAISGGEPLLRDDLPLILQRIKKRKMIAKLVTNGSLVAARINEICSYLDVINFSFDSLHPPKGQGGDRIKVLTEPVIEGIRAAVQNIPHVGLNMVLTRSSSRELEEILEVGSGLGIGSFTFFPLISHFSYKTPAQFATEYAELYGSLDNYLATVSKLKELRDKGYRITMSDMMLDALASFKIPRMQCISGYLSCGISPDGRLGTCYEFYRETTASYKEKSFAELWQDLGRNLQVVDTCPGCLLHCYFEPNAMFSLYPKPIITYGKRYFRALLS